MAGTKIVNVTTDLQPVVDKISIMTERGQNALVNQVYADMNMYVPMLTGQLRQESQISGDGKSITWNSVYAAYQYYLEGSNYSSPNTGPYWDKKAAANHAAQWGQVAGRAMNL